MKNSITKHSAKIKTKKSARLYSNSAPLSLAAIELRRLWVTFNELPYQAIAFLSFAAGTGAIYRYFLSIEYWPGEIHLIVALAALAASGILLGVLALTALLFATVWMTKLYEINPVSPLYLFVGQVGAANIALAYLFRRLEYWPAFMILSILCSIYMAWRLVKGRHERTVLDALLTVVPPILGGLFAMFALLVVASMAGYSKNPQQRDWELIFAILSTALIAYFAANAFLTDKRLPFLYVVLIALACAVASIVFLAEKGAVSTALASKLGIRIDGVSELRVSEATCRHVTSSLFLENINDKSKSSLAHCQKESNRVMAEVLLRWGSRWLIIPKSINGWTTSNSTMKITIPDVGTELVFR